MLVIYIALASFVIGGAVVTLADSYTGTSRSRY